MSDEMKQLQSSLNKYNLSPNSHHYRFLLAWKSIVGFGFKGIQGFGNQVMEAVHYYFEAEKEWHNLVLNDETNLTFISYFISKSKDKGLDLPNNFEEEMNKKLEEME